MPTQEFFSEVTIEVAWGDMDAWQHVNNTMYFRYIETARIRYLVELGWNLDEGQSVVPVLSSVEAKFRRPVLFPSRLRVLTRPTELREAKFTLEHHLFVLDSPDARPATLGTSVVVPFDQKTGSATRVPEAIRARLAAQLAKA